MQTYFDYSMGAFANTLAITSDLNLTPAPRTLDTNVQSSGVTKRRNHQSCLSLTAAFLFPGKCVVTSEYIRAPVLPASSIPIISSLKIEFRTSGTMTSVPTYGIPRGVSVRGGPTWSSTALLRSLLPFATRALRQPLDCRSPTVRPLVLLDNDGLSAMPGISVPGQGSEYTLCELV